MQLLVVLVLRRGLLSSLLLLLLLLRHHAALPSAASPGVLTSALAHSSWLARGRGVVPIGSPPSCMRLRCLLLLLQALLLLLLTKARLAALAHAVPAVSALVLPVHAAAALLRVESRVTAKAVHACASTWVSSQAKRALRAALLRLVLLTTEASAKSTW